MFGAKPSMVNDPAFRNWAGSYERLGASPSAAIKLMKLNSQIDIRDVLPSVRVPTLVIHRTGDLNVAVEGGRELANAIPDARLGELPGVDHMPFIGDNSDEIADLVGEFVTGNRVGETIDRVLATIVFTDIAKSTEQVEVLGDRKWRDVLSAHDQAVRVELKRCRGTEIKSLGDGFMTTFDGPGRAIRFAHSVIQNLKSLGIDLRAGIHTGEIIQSQGDVHGIAVNIAARVTDTAKPGEILVSRTVRDLVAGSGFELVDHGQHFLKGVAEEWQLFKVVE